MDLRVEADRVRAWTALVFVGLRFLVVCGALLIGGALLGIEDAPSIGDALLGTATFAVVLTLTTGTPMALWWWLRPGRVSYEVSDGELRILRGARIVQRHPCADITAVTLRGALNWRALLLRNWFGWNYSIAGWPELLVDRKTWPKPRLLVGARSQPAILLWGEQRCIRAERDLREAVTSHGAVLSNGL